MHTSVVTYYRGGEGANPLGHYCDFIFRKKLKLKSW